MDQNLKHRLTGAIILVSLAVIFIPVILEGPDNEWTPLSHGLPESPQLDYKARIELPQSVETPALVKRTQKVVEKPTYKLAEPAAKKSIATAPEPEVTSEIILEVTPEVTPEAPPAEVLSGWYVQVGSFSQELNAKGLDGRLELSGYDTRVLKTGTAYRVIVGPGTDQEKAEKLRDKLAKELKLKGIVINFPG